MSVLPRMSRFPRRLSLVLLAATCAAILAGVALLVPDGGIQTASAAGRYPSAATGYDISWPQCGTKYPAAPFGFAIVGVNGGHMFSHNPCLASQYQWAKQGVRRAAAVYLNTTFGLLRGRCRAANQACQAYNYGYFAAKDAYAYARSQGVASRAMWWLDVETQGGRWTGNTALNSRVLRGAVAYLRGRGLALGIYCTPYQWGLIASGYMPRLPVWAAGAPHSNPASYCAPAKSVGGGPVWITQGATWYLDYDYSC
jgi:hypothetical protein